MTGNTLAAAVLWAIFVGLLVSGVIIAISAAMLLPRRRKDAGFHISKAKKHDFYGENFERDVP